MFFIITPQDPSQVYYNPEEAFEDYRRREYVAALREEQAQRAQFERELALEEERHRRALASLHQQEILRRRQSRLDTPSYAQPRPQRASFCRPKPADYVRVDPEEILRRRQARQEEEQRRAREFHQNILSQIFGVPEEQLRTPSATPQQQEQEQKQPAQPTTNDKGKQRAQPEASASKSTFAEEAEQEPHWSAAPKRAAALAEISSINRAFASLKNTFTFPSGPLERLAGSDLPRLAYNSTNASIHAYEHALSELLSKLDGVESHGFKGVREARKQLVVKIEKELEDLEKQIAERLAGASSPAVASTSIPIESASPVASTSVPIESASPVVATVEVSAPVAESSIDTEMKDDTTSKAPATEGYDVEFEEPAVSEPAPVIETTVTEAPAESNEAMDVEPTTEAPVETTEVVSPVPVATPSVFAEDATKESKPVEQVATTESAAVPVSEPTAEVLSEEDSEIEDAVHVVIESSDDEKDVDEKRERARDQEGDFELV